MNYKNFGSQPMDSRSGSGRPPVNHSNYPLARQGSIYSLTFDELLNTMGSIGKDFGSMNMDELLKNIWNAEEMQTMGVFGTTGNVQDRGGVGGANLQRQGSVTLPRTLSQKTVDEVWKDLSKEYGNGFGKPDLSLGEMTLEEFLFKAGGIREETGLDDKPNDNGLVTNLASSQKNPAFGAVGFQQTVGQNQNAAVENGGINQISFLSANLPVSGNGVQSTQTQQQQLFQKQPVLPYGARPMGIPAGNQMTGSVIRNGVMGLSDPVMNGNLVSTVMAGSGTPGGVTVSAGSPAVSSDGLPKSNGYISSVSPAPYTFDGVLRGRRSGTIEIVVERRQRRMIKNRESAARSRARKQAYTMELETEVLELKKKNQELKRKQEELMEMQKNQVMEMMQPGSKGSCLGKTHSGPW